MANNHSILQDKSFSFALQIIGLCKKLQEDKEFVLSKQLLRSGTAIGALIREAEHAESKADFIHKMAIAQKEANESKYWIELLFQSDYIKQTKYQEVTSKIDELNKILASILITSKKRK